MQSTAGGVDWSRALDSFAAGVAPFLPWLALLATISLALRCPLLGRGPGLSKRRDPWRGFRFDARRQVFERAGGRCEGSRFLLWGRCREPATETDHVYPWSRGGATVLANGQALCKGHNRRKSSLTPPWWYVLTLERRRRAYFPKGVDVRVRGKMGPADRALRRQWADHRVGTGTTQPRPRRFR